MRNHIAAVVLGCAALLAGSAARAEISSLDRRLDVAVNGFAFNEPAAASALAAGADINNRDDALDNDTPLIQAIRGFKEPAVIKWLLDHGADPSLTNDKGQTAADYAKQYHSGNTAVRRALLALLEPGPAGGPAAGGPPGGPPAAGGFPTEPAPAAFPPAQARADPPRPALVRASTAGPTDAGMGGAPVPGVYECMNQQAMISPMAFGLIDGSTYTTSGGRRGRYSYDAGTGVLTLDPGATPARYKRTGANLFRPLLENGQLGGFTCPLNRAKSPTRLPW